MRDSNDERLLFSGNERNVVWKPGQVDAPIALPDATAKATDAEQSRRRHSQLRSDSLEALLAADGVELRAIV